MRRFGQLLGKMISVFTTPVKHRRARTARELPRGGAVRARRRIAFPHYLL